MKNCVYYELRKTVFTRKNIIVAAVLALLMIGFLIWNERSFISEKKARERFFDDLGNVTGDELTDYLSSEEQKLYSKIFPDDGESGFDSSFAGKTGRYGISNVGEWALFKEALKIAEDIQTRNENISIIIQNPENFAVDSYYEEDNIFFSDTKPQTEFVRNSCFGWIAVLACIIVLAGSFSVEKERGLHSMLQLFPKGGVRMSLRKYICGIVVGAVLVISYALIYCIAQFIILGLGFKELGMPLFMIEGYEMCASGMTVGGLFGYTVMFSIAAAAVMSSVTMLLSKLIGRTVFAGIGSCIIYAAGIAADVLYMGVYGNEFTDNSGDWYLISAPTFYKIYNTEKGFNPLALLNNSYYFQQPRITRFAGGYYDAYIVPLIIVILCCFLCYIFLLKEEKNVK